MPYRIKYSPDFVNHLRGLTVRQQATVLDQVGIQLTHHPIEPTRNRKPMRPNSVAPRELRIGDLRVYYDVKDEPGPVVLIRAVGRKVGNVVFVGGEEVEL